MMENNGTIPTSAFPFANESAEVMKSVAEHIAKLVGDHRESYIKSQNVQKFRHGLNWQAHNSSFSDDVSTLQHQQHFLEVPITQILDGNVDYLFNMMQQTAESMHATFAQMLYQTVGQAADRVGNVVEGTRKNSAQLLYESLELLEFGIGPDGEPVLPGIHLGKDAFESFINDPELNDPAFKEKLEALKQRKMSDARAREAERLSRFEREND